MGDIINKINEFTQFDFKGLAGILNSLSPIEFAALSCLVGLICSMALDNNEQDTIGNFLEAVGQIILTAQAQGSIQLPQTVTQNEFINFKNETNYKLDMILKHLNKHI